MARKKEEIGVIEVFDDATAIQWKGICTADVKAVFSDYIGNCSFRTNANGLKEVHFSYFNADLQYIHVWIPKDNWLIIHGPKNYEVLTPNKYKEWKNKRIMVQKLPVVV